MPAEPWGFQSSSLNAGQYDEETGVMTLTFHSGHAYEYKVPKEIWDGLKAAPSPGQFFHQNIKGKF